VSVFWLGQIAKSETFEKLISMKEIINVFF